MTGATRTTHTFAWGLVPQTNQSLKLVISVSDPAAEKGDYTYQFRVQTFPATVPERLPVSLPHPGGLLVLTAHSLKDAGNGELRLYAPSGAVMGQTSFAVGGVAQMVLDEAPAGRYVLIAGRIGSDYELTVSGHAHPSGFLRLAHLGLQMGPTHPVGPDGKASWTTTYAVAPVQLGARIASGPVPLSYSEGITIRVTFPGGERENFVFQFCETLVTGGICGNPTSSTPFLDPRLVPGTYGFEYEEGRGINSAAGDYVFTPAD